MMKILTGKENMVALLKEISGEELRWRMSLTTDAVYQCWNRIILNLKVFRNFLSSPLILDTNVIPPEGFKPLGYPSFSQSRETTLETIPLIISKMETVMKEFGDCFKALRIQTMLAHGCQVFDHKIIAVSKPQLIEQLCEDLPCVLKSIEYSFKTPFNKENKDDTESRCSQIDIWWCMCSVWGLNAELDKILDHIEKWKAEEEKSFKEYVGYFKEPNHDTRKIIKEIMGW